MSDPLPRRIIGRRSEIDASRLRTEAAQQSLDGNYSKAASLLIEAERLMRFDRERRLHDEMAAYD